MIIQIGKARIRFSRTCCFKSYAVDWVRAKGDLRIGGVYFENRGRFWVANPPNILETREVGEFKIRREAAAELLRIYRRRNRRAK